MPYLRTIISFIRDEDHRELFVATLSTLAVGTLVYRYLEDWSWLDAFYFSAITLTTVGYGDLYPSHPFSKIFTIFYIIVGIGILLSFIEAFHEHHSEIRAEEKK